MLRLFTLHKNNTVFKYCQKKLAVSLMAVQAELLLCQTKGLMGGNLGLCANVFSVFLNILEQSITWVGVIFVWDWG